MVTSSARFKTTVTSRLLAMKFFGEFMLIYPLYTIMFGERGGVTASGIGILVAAGYVLSVLFEVPTGVLADKIARKYVLVMASVGKIAALSSWLVFPNFGGYFLGTAIFALATALESGALQAYLYGTLGEDNKKLFGKFWSRVSAMIMVSYTLAYIAASLIGVKYDVLLGASIASALVSVVIAVSLPVDTLPVSVAADRLPILRTALRHLGRSPQIKKLVATSLVIVVVAEVMTELVSLYYSQVGVEVRYVPLVLAFGNVLGALSFWTLHSWERILDTHKTAITLSVVAVFIASLFGGVWIVAAGVLTALRYARVLQVQFESRLQHLSNDEARATIASLVSFAVKLGAAALVLLIGLSARSNSIVWPFRIVTLAGICFYLILYVVLQKKSSAEALPNKP